MAISYSPRSGSPTSHHGSPTRLSFSSQSPRASSPTLASPTHSNHSSHSLTNADRSTPSPGTGRTNTLAIAGLRKPFFQDLVLGALREHFDQFGTIVHWVALPSFGRILVVYEDEDDAENAKVTSDPIVVEAHEDRPEITVRVYRADHTPLDTFNGTTSEGRYLLPPQTEKNFLISPPGSPPVGWEPIKEDPPNSNPLADDLMQALKKLQFEQRHRRTSSSSSSGSDHDGTGEAGKRRSSVEVLLEPDDVIGVGVYVENCDEDEDAEGEDGDVRMGGDEDGIGSSWGGVCKPIPTAMPPMQGASGITPTAMPPIRV